MPDFPAVHHDFPGGPARWAALEAAHAGCRLKPGNICPHRGIDLTPFAKPDGTAVCPGHGLRWNLKTGELLPHHSCEVTKSVPKNLAATCPRDFSSADEAAT
jgi:hypothetical protein